MLNSAFSVAISEQYNNISSSILKTTNSCVNGLQVMGPYSISNVHFLNISTWFPRMLAADFQRLSLVGSHHQAQSAL